MGQRSKVLRLPPEVREEVGNLWKLWSEEGKSLDELVARIRELGGDISRSSLHRYFRDLEKTGKRLNEAQQIAGALVERIGASRKGKVGRLLQELLASIALRQLGAIDETGDSVEPQELMFLAKSIQSVISAEKTSAELEIKIEERVKRALEEKSKKVVEAAREGGLSDDAAEKIRRALIGEDG